MVRSPSEAALGGESEHIDTAEVPIRAVAHQMLDRRCTICDPIVAAEH